MSAVSPWRWLATAVWLLIALGYLVFFVTDLRLDIAQTQVPCSGAACNYLALSQAESDVLQRWNWSLRSYALIVNGATVLAVVVSWLLGGLILWRQGGSRIGWSVSLALIAIPVSLISDADNVAASHPELMLPSVGLSMAGFTILLLFFYLFPTGHFYPRWGYIPFLVTWAAFTVLGPAISVLLPVALGPEPAMWPTLILLLILAGYLQIQRYRHSSTAVERQQTKWVLLGIFLLMLCFPIWMATFGGPAIAPGQPRLLASTGGWILIMTLITSLPVTMAIAILRYRLWDIDLIIRRTLIYGVLSGLLALVYFGSVVVLEGALRGLTGGGSQAAIVLSTLLIAALFGPLRGRVQRAIDRRFYRRKYDAAHTLAAFGASVRDEVDLDALGERLTGVVDEAMQPATVGLWVKVAKRPAPDGDRA